jgi:hypothetical protein
MNSPHNQLALYCHVVSISLWDKKDRFHQENIQPLADLFPPELFADAKTLFLNHKRGLNSSWLAMK